MVRPAGRGIEFSRPLGVAESLGEHASDRHRFLDKRVLLTGDEATLESANGTLMLLDALRLLVRMTPNLTVCVPSACPVRRSAEILARAIEFDTPVRFVTDPIDLSQFDAILSVGSAVRPDLPWTAILSNGWVAGASSGRVPLDPGCDQANPMAALFAACLGATEVFKRLLKVRASRGPLLDGETFSLLTLAPDPDGQGPNLPQRLPVDLVLGGVGAIGNGVALLLSQLPVEGRVILVDPQVFAPENLGTCVLIGPKEIGRAKVEVVAELFGPAVTALPRVEAISRFVEHVGQEIVRPRVAIGAFDSDEARRELQDAWCDLVLDGAIGALICQVGRHPWGPDVACLRCVNPDTRRTERAELVQSRALGLPPDRLSDLEREISDGDVASADPARRAWLATQRGRRICSVLPEAVARRLIDERPVDGFAPSAPFVACMSACLVVAELVKHSLALESRLEPQFQFDVLRGPRHGLPFESSRRPDCTCAARRRVIERLRGR